MSSDESHDHCGRGWFRNSSRPCNSEFGREFVEAVAKGRTTPVVAVALEWKQPPTLQWRAQCGRRWAWEREKHTSDVVMEKLCKE